MVWEFQCPTNGCAYTASDNEQNQVIENAQQHMRDKHDNMPTQDDVVRYVVGP